MSINIKCEVSLEIDDFYDGDEVAEEVQEMIERCSLREAERVRVSFERELADRFGCRWMKEQADA